MVETHPTRIPTPTPPTSRKPKTPPRIEIKVSWCKGCGLCVDYCNLGVLEMDGTLPQVVKVERCTRCMQCEVICPDFAIRVTDATTARADAATTASVDAVPEAATDATPEAPAKERP